jgi:hypothetical protein
MGGIVKVKSVSRLDKPYEGSDILMEWHKERMKSTPHDADYATPIWRCETDLDRAKEYLTWIAMWTVLLGTLYLLATWFEGVAQ